MSKPYHKLAFFAIVLGVLVGVHILTSEAQTVQPISPFYFKTATSAYPINVSTTLTLPQLGAGTYCLHSVAGTITATAGDCSAGGGGSSTLIFAGNGILVNASGTNGYIIINTGVTSTAGNWIGTWQGINSSTFYLATNPSGYLTTSTGLTTANFATTSISQWNNDSKYITTSTNNFGGLTNASVTAQLPIVWTNTSTIICPTCVSTNTGNWAGTWINATSGTYYPYSNPLGFITSTQAGLATTTINASGTTLNGPNFTFATSTTILPYASGTSLYWKLASLAISQFTNDSGYIATSVYNASITIATAAPLGGGGQLSNNGTLNLTCTGCLTANQTITLTGAVTGSGATTIATVYTTSTLFAFFSATAPITYNTSTGAIGITTTTFAMNADNLSGLANTSTARTNLGLKATSSLALADANGIQSSYGGSNCAAGSVATGLSATGTVPCVTTSTILAGYSTSTGANPTASVRATAVNGSANTFMRSDAAPALAAQYVSSTATFLWGNATTTQPSSLNQVPSYSARTLSAVDCWEEAAATTTVELYYNTTLASSGIGQVLLSSIACGINGTSTTSFTTTTIPAGSWIWGVVSSTAGTPTQTWLNIYTKK